VGDEGSHVALGRSVIIVGTGSLQNKLLANLIEQRTGYACSTRPADQLNGSLPATSLALIDAAEFAASMQVLYANGLFQSIAVINADERLPLEVAVACPGVKGVFFADSSEDTLVKGIEAIFRGEYWLPRRLLCAHLERTRTVQRPASLAATLLTRKELETLRLLATGSSTGDIAHELKVSPHTVKTHLYNLFRKIRVTNRVQAVHWAAQNKIGPDPIS
jgi:LuxR family transcriptional regulator of csgAB operon